MPEIGTSGSMSGDGKRGVAAWPQATAPILDSTICMLGRSSAFGELRLWRGEKSVGEGQLCLVSRYPAGRD
jgi:hypothetical protein